MAYHWLRPKFRDVTTIRGIQKAVRGTAVEIYVGKASEFTERDRRIVVHDDLEIGVFHIDGEFYAYENNCVHQGGPACQGRIINKVEEAVADDKTSLGLRYSKDEIHIVCPWHGYEYNIKTGRHPGRHDVRLRPFDVTVTGDDVIVHV